MGAGKAAAEAVAEYLRWKKGLYCAAEKRQFRQHPLDYIEAFTSCVREALRKAGADVAAGVAALSVDTTGSTPCPADKDGKPLALREEFAQLQKKIAEYESILKSEKKLLNVIKKELGEIGEQFKNARRTEILKDDKTEDLLKEDEDDLPVPEDAVVLYTRGGQLRRMTPRLYEKIDVSTAESDMPLFLLRTQTDHTLLIFTDRGACYTLNVGAIAESLRVKERGTALTGILQGFEKGEKCV